MPEILLSFVLPVYNEAEGIRTFHASLLSAVGTIDAASFEFVYVNDGSDDDSLLVLGSIATADSRVRVLDLARNYGHQIAITAGMDAARGAAVVIMDTDLQDPPAVVPQLVRAWRDGADVAYAQRRSRRDGPIKKATAHAYYRVLDGLSDRRIPRDTGDFRLMSRRAVDALTQYRERHRYVRGMVADIGFTQVAVPFDRDERHTGSTGYTWTKMLRLATDGILGFSSRPLTFIAQAGIAIAAISAVLGLYALGVRIFAPEMAVPGWAFIAAGTFFIGGVQIFMIGVLGAYVGRIYAEVQHRPLYLLRSDSRADVAEGMTDAVDRRRQDHP